MVKKPTRYEIEGSNIPTTPYHDNRLILVTGANGYIGGRLIPVLLDRGYRVRILVRKDSPEYKERWPAIDIAVADAMNLHGLSKALEGVHTAFYLIHSLGLGSDKFETADLKIAENFRIAAENQNLQRIIYLGGLGDKNTRLSQHLESRIKVAQSLSKGKTSVTVLRAGMIIGSGSASFEILKNLVNNTPVFFVPKWAKTRSQPISIRGVLNYLVGVMELEETAGQEFDIGGNDILTYDEKLKVLAKLLGKKRLVLPGILASPKLYAFFISLLTPVAKPITTALVVGCKNEVVCQNNDIKKYLDIELLSFKDALIRALSREEMDMIATRWTDAYPPAHTLAIKLNELNYATKYRSSYIILSHKTPSEIFNSVCQVGGKHGWFRKTWVWKVKSMLDIIFMGGVVTRGRRSFSSLRINDVIDYWRVENLIENKLLLLRAEARIPGKAWLGFNIDEGVGITKFSVNVYFEPKGIKGILYWYNFLPLHTIIFKKLLKQIENK